MTRMKFLHWFSLIWMDIYRKTMLKFFTGLCKFLVNEILFLNLLIYHSRGNIPGTQIDKGETLCSYLPPFPPNGSGWHRCAFILYKHAKGPINFSQVYGTLPGER